MLATGRAPGPPVEPKRLRAIPGRIAVSARRAVPHLPRHAPWAGLLLQAFDRVRRAQARAAAEPTGPRPCDPPRAPALFMGPLCDEAEGAGGVSADAS